MRYLGILLAALSLSACIGIGAGRSCSRFYGVAVPLVRVGVHTPCR